MSPASPAGAPLEVLTSPAGALSLATVALLLVLGLRLARPRGALASAAAIAYAAALVATLLGGLRLVPGAALAAPLAARLAGVAAIAIGLVLAGAAQRRLAPGANAPRRAPPVVHLGLVLVLAGQLLRAPSAAGATAVAAAALLHALAARAAAREPA